MFLGAVRKSKEILLKIEENQEKVGSFVIYANEFFGANRHLYRLHIS